MLAFMAESWERLWPRLVPAFLVIVTFVTVSWMGVWQWLPDWGRWAPRKGQARTQHTGLPPREQR